MSELSVLIVIGFIVAYWWAAMKVKEIAVRAAKRACLRHDVQFLDETVAMRKLGLARDGNGRLRFSRSFTFEFSTDEDQRRAGSVDLVGKRVTSLILDLGDHTLYEQAAH